MALADAHHVLEAMPVGVFLTDADGDCRFVNRKWCEMTGARPEAAVGRGWADVVHPADRDLVCAEWLAAASGQRPFDLAFRYLSPAGPIWVLGRANPMHDGDGRLLGHVGTVVDIRARIESEEALQRSESSFRALVERLPDALVIHVDGIVTYVNPAALDLMRCGPQALLGRPALDLVAADDRRATGTRIEDLAKGPGDRTGLAQTTLRRPDGTTLVAETVGTRVVWNRQPAIAFLARDIEERRALESRLRVSERLAALGTMSSGVAHEINNPLTYVQVQLIALQDGLGELAAPPAPERLRELQSMVADASHGTERIAKIVRSLRSLTRTAEARPSPRDLGRVIDGALQLVAADVRRRARLVRNLDDVPPVLGDDARLGQVIVNLVLNAVQSIPLQRDEPGTIMVTLSTGAQGWVVVEVVDDGIGISADARARVFDPFYTGARTGPGLGLGLSVTHGIVESLGGRIELHSEEGRGTRVSVSFPPASIAIAG